MHSSSVVSTFRCRWIHRAISSVLLGRPVCSLRRRRMQSAVCNTVITVVFFTTVVALYLLMINWLLHFYAKRRLLSVAENRKFLTYLSTKNWGIGNHMFAFASTLAIAHRKLSDFPVTNGNLSASTSHWVVCFDPWSPLRIAFKRLADWPACHAQDVLELLGGVVHSEAAYARYDEDLVNSLPSDNHVVLNRFLQSWKYFSGAETALHHLFEFNDVIQRQAHAALADVVEKHFGCVGCYDKGDVIAVGVHVRRGDMELDGNLRERGYVTANADYLLLAMDYIVEKLRKNDELSRRRPVFIICSDDITWCRNELTDSRHGENIAFVSTRDPFVDLAVLAQCRHVVLTVGTFGWWAAWLSNGTTVYYGDWPRPGSALAAATSRDDYFYPNWIPIRT